MTKNLIDKVLAACVLMALAAVAPLTLAGCGGGGSTGGGSSTITGRIVQVETGGAPNPQATVQIGSNTVLSNASDGSFSLSASAGTTTVTVDTHTTDGVFVFTITPPASGATEDVGDLWVGPQQVTLEGQIVDSSNQNPISGATVKFGGRSGITASDGSFALNSVVYPNSNLAAFWGIVGQVAATNYFANSFSAQPNVASGGIVQVGIVPMTPLSSATPPGVPSNIYGSVTPAALGAGSTIVLSLNGTAIRQTIADSTGTYYLWVPPGTYQLTGTNGAHTSGPISVTVKSTSDVEHVNVTLN